MKMNEVLLIKLDTNGFERFYDQKIRAYGCTVLPLRDYRWEKWGFTALRPGGLRTLTPEFLAQYRLIILFEEPALYLYLKKRIDPARTKLLIWNWNITNRTWLRGDAPLRRQCENWTFDATDARKFGWKLNEQFYFKPEQIPVPVVHPGKMTAFSACVDKGRYPLMKEIRQALQHSGVETDFCLVREPLRRYAPEDAGWVKDKGLPYERFLAHTIRSDLVVEVVQEQQVGITVRALEAVFYNKKLITNNAAVRQTPLYRPGNVLIWDAEAAENLDAFLRAEYQPLPDAVKNQYTFETWLGNFCKG